MSQHRIIGSEAFERQPCVHVHTFRPGAFHRRKGGSTLTAFVAGAGVTVALGIGAALLAFPPGVGL